MVTKISEVENLSNDIMFKMAGAESQSKSRSENSSSNDNLSDFEGCDDDEVVVREGGKYP